MQAFGLYLSLAAVAITLAVLLYDFWLGITGRKTISEGVWLDLDTWRRGAGPFPWRSVLMVLGMALAPVGMALHFFL